MLPRSHKSLWKLRSDLVTWVHDVNYSLVWKEKIKINPFKPRSITFPVIVHIAEEVDECFG